MSAKATTLRGIVAEALRSYGVSEAQAKRMVARADADSPIGAHCTKRKLSPAEAERAKALVQLLFGVPVDVLDKLEKAAESQWREQARRN